MTEDKIQKTISESANNVEINAYNILKSTGWDKIDENTYFTDPTENILRETDILAIKEVSVDCNGGNKHRIIFLIECKYIKDKVVFWFKDKKTENAKSLINRNYLFSNQPFNPLSIARSSHHYINVKKVAKKWDYVRWDYEKNKPKECHDLVGKSINQLMNALYFYSRQHGSFKNKSTIFPILVINDYSNVFQVMENGGYDSINQHFQLEVEYSMKIGNHGVEPFYQLIDVVSVKELINFIEYFNSNTYKLILSRLASESINASVKKLPENPINPAR